MKKLLLAIVLIVGCVGDTSKPKNIHQKWKATYYVDDFGDPTTDGYITNVPAIWGKFSNSATTNSKLKVNFIIEPDQIAIVLWEYGNLKVRGLSYKHPGEYIIHIKHNGVSDKFWGVNEFDRIILV